MKRKGYKTLIIIFLDLSWPMENKTPSALIKYGWHKNARTKKTIPGLMVLVYSCINKQALPYKQELLKFKICNYNLRGSGTLLMAPNF